MSDAEPPSRLHTKSHSSALPSGSLLHGAMDHVDSHAALIMAQAHASTSGISHSRSASIDPSGSHETSKTTLRLPHKRNTSLRPSDEFSDHSYRNSTSSRGTSPSGSRPTSPNLVPPLMEDLLSQKLSSAGGEGTLLTTPNAFSPSPPPPPFATPAHPTLSSPRSSPFFANLRTPELSAFFSTFTPVINGRRFSSVLADTEVLLQPMKASALFLAQLDPAIITFFLVSISFTISRKMLLRQPDGIFPFPFILLGTQTACVAAATNVARKTGTFRAVKLTPRQETVLKLLALLFSLEDLTSTLSLRFVTVPVGHPRRHVMGLSVVFSRQQTSLRTTSTFILVVLGVILTSLNLDIHSFGSSLAITSTILLSIKSFLVTHVLTNKYGLGTLDLVSRIAPLSIAHYAIFATLGGELGAFGRFLIGPELTKSHFSAIVITGALSVGLLFASDVAEKRVRAPAPAISGHASQAFTIIVSAVVFALPLSPVNFVGVALTLGGGIMFAWYDALDAPPVVKTALTNRGLPTSVGPGSKGVRD